MGSAAEGEPLGRIRELAEALRAAGVPVGTGRLLGLARAAAAMVPTTSTGPPGRPDLAPRGLDAFHRAFASVFGLPERPPPGPPPVADRRQRVTVPADLGAAAGVDESADTALASPVETLRRKDFAGCTDAELAQIARLMARLRLRAPERRTRRRRPARSGDPDLRRTLRRAMRTGGEPIERAWRRRRVQRRRLLLVLDVSGSMSTYSRSLALFAHASLRAGPGDWEAFAFGTRLTRMTRALSVADADVAIAAAGRRGGRLGRRDPDRRVAEAPDRRARPHARGARCDLRDPVGRPRRGGPGGSSASRWRASRASPTAWSGSTR